MLAPQEFRVFRADVFVSQAVIQHFPNRAFADTFFANLERSCIPLLQLQLKVWPFSA